MVHKLLPQARILPDNLAHPDTGCRTEGFAMVSFGWPGPSGDTRVPFTLG
jgi:hypothetical protein